MNLLNKLKSLENSNSTDKVIARYILKHRADVSRMSIDQLAKSTYCSRSSIVRFAQKLGFTGFKSLKIELVELDQILLLTDNSVDANFPFDKRDNTNEVMKKIADLSIGTIKKTLAQLEFRAVDKAANVMIKSRNIFIFARGDSQIRARSFQNRMVKLGIFIIIAEEYSDEIWVAKNIKKGDSAIFITYGSKSSTYGDIIKDLNTKNIDIIMITGNIESGLIKKNSILLTVVQDERDNDKISTFSSQIAFDFLLNTLFSKIYLLLNISK